MDPVLVRCQINFLQPKDLIPRSNSLVQPIRTFRPARILAQIFVHDDGECFWQIFCYVDRRVREVRRVHNQNSFSL